MGADLAVIVVTHNSEPDLARCLDSVATHAGGLALFIVVSDSGSSDGTATVACGYPVAYLPGPNDGFARGCNRALGRPDVREARYVLLLNPDTQILDGSLADLVACCDALPESGIFSVRQVDETGRLIRSIRRFPTPRRILAEAVRWRAVLRHGQSRLDGESYETVTASDWLWGAFLLLRRKAVDELGGFDERFFLYSEEVDLCRRAWAAGWSVTHVPSMTIEHRIARREPDLREYLVARGQLTYARKWLGPWRRALFRVALAARSMAVAADPGRSPTERARGRIRLRGALGLPPGGSGAALPRGRGQGHVLGRPPEQDALAGRSTPGV